jgi:hypothetical protein
MSMRHDAGALADRNGSIGWAITVLTDQGMPSREIGTMLGADDPELIRRLFELHRERLEESLADQRRTLARLESLLAARSMARAACLQLMEGAES